jgi:hypothetical protein
MSSKAISKHDEALQLLEDLDSLSPAPSSASLKGDASPTGPANLGEAAEVLAFLDELTQKSTTKSTSSLLERPLSRAGTPSLRKSTERVRVGASASGSPTIKTESPKIKPAQPEQAAAAAPSGGWGWGSVWSSATAAIQQAKSAVDEQVKQLPKNEQARKWSEGVMEYAKAAQLDKIGQDFKRVGLSTLTDILNVVAPPISEHEVIQVWLSHDMKGFEGIESLTYRALARIMEQVEGGDLIVNRGEESRPKDSSGGRELNAVDGYEAAFKLAQANLDEFIKRNSKPTPERSSTDPTTYSQVYLRVQPFMSSFEFSEEATDDGAVEDNAKLQFILHLSDPGHNLVHTTVTQAIPGKWLELWDQYDWVEDLVAEAIRVGVEVIGQEYVVERMGWGSKGGQTPEAEAQEESVEP